MVVLFALGIYAVRAADGGGTNTVSPTSASISSTGNTFTFTYTSDATKDSGGMTIAVPSGWSAPQGSAGTAGYTTVSSTGTMGDSLSSLDAATGWTAGNHMTLSADTSDKQEATASLSNAIGSYASANEQWYYEPASTQNWGGNNGTGNYHVGMWLKSSVTTASGNLSFQLDDTADLASPLDTISVAALTADTWTYTSVTLGAGSRTSVLSYGFRYSTDIGSATVKADSVSALFDDADQTTNWGGDSNITVAALGGSAQKEGNNAIRCTYASSAGTGTSGDCLYSKSSSETWGPGTKVSFWIRSSVATNAGDFDWVDDNASLLASVEDSVDIPALSANTWTYVTLSLAGSSANKLAKSWGIRQQVDNGALTIDLDAMGKQVISGEDTTNWTAAGSGAQALSADTGVKKEGSGSLLDTIGAGAAAGDKWWYTFGSTQDWSSYTTVGVWARSSVATSSGDLQFEYDDQDELASPIGTLSLGALSANTWSFQKLTLSGTRTSIKSYGIKYTTDIGAANVYLDYVLLGPGSPTFSGSGPWTIAIPFLSLASSETVTVTYGSGGGTSGVTAPGSANTYTFTTQTRDAVDGTLTSISSSPTIETSSQSLSFSLSDNSVGFGTLSASSARYATGDTNGTGSETSAHTLSASANATGGYVITLTGSTLTHTLNPSYTITAIGGTNTASSVGTEQFGLRLAVDSGNGSVTAPYAAAGFALDTAAFPDQVASGNGDGTTTVFSARYLANITTSTEAGSYSASLTYVATGTF